ncbi:unnamed protein product [Lactuca virosa]|uniref:Uncharacterized protein n=1 Tax=Lactuca virosa TaxID=75947 RepID=A0AAU9PCA3_9ASTR|nr:unnamed protein product [Lactuca virosa]
MFNLLGGGMRVITDNPPSAYDVIKSYNLPIGVLPQGVVGYNLDPNIHMFSVNLGGYCNFHIGKYKVKYSPMITVKTLTQESLQSPLTINQPPPLTLDISPAIYKNNY